MGSQKELQTHAEIEAKKAERLRAFGGLNLSHVRRQVALFFGNDRARGYL
jgi:hypothetical protein